MNKIIIENHTSMEMEDVLIFVRLAISERRPSETPRGLQYSVATTWPDGLRVCTYLNKRSDRFVVTEIKQGD